MKRFLFLILAICLLLAFTSCTKKKEEAAEETSTVQETSGKAETGAGETMTGFDLQEGYETPIIFRN